MRVSYRDYVTVVNNDTKEEVSGYIQKYTPDEIVLHVPTKFDAKKVHFKEKAKRDGKS